MKKFLTLICMITCIFGLTACGSEEELNKHELENLTGAQQIATEAIDLFVKLVQDGEKENLSMYNKEELEYMFGSQINGAAVMKALDSFEAALEEMGGVVGVDSADAEPDGNKIVVEAVVKGEKKDAKAEIILSNDMFLKVDSIALNPINSKMDLMGTAGLNTLLGIGTVFSVLIIIICVISALGIIPKIQAKLQEKDKTEASIDNAVAQIVGQEENAGTDDTELVAVIAAAIAAYEGSTSTDGFVVRSIRKRFR